jgi:hypothetical protein
MERVENAALPKIEIFCTSLEKEPAARAVGYGIEEEGLPYAIHAIQSERGDCSGRTAYEAAHRSGLGVSVLISESWIEVYARQLQEERPLFRHETEAGEAAKTIGKNAARIIKNKPFLDFDRK